MIYLHGLFVMLIFKNIYFMFNNQTNIRLNAYQQHVHIITAIVFAFLP